MVESWWLLFLKNPKQQEVGCLVNAFPKLHKNLGSIIRPITNGQVDTIAFQPPLPLQPSVFLFFSGILGDFAYLSLTLSKGVTPDRPDSIGQNLDWTMAEVTEK